MQVYQVLLTWKVIHDYYRDGICRGIDLCPDGPTQALLHRKGGMLKRVAENEWALLGEEMTKWEDGEEIVLGVRITDDRFYYFTEMERHKDEIRVSPKEVGQGKEILLSYRAKSLYWEYVLIARIRNVERSLVLREKNGRLEYTEPGQVDMPGQRAWRVITTEPVGLREHYDYQMQLVEKKALGEKMICRQVSCPEPGKFPVAGEGCIRQVVYY